ncbi:pyruvate dehydrogenase (acetyl-transferring) E1 component subunit alpha [Saxibacter everestensis]|uniref:Pyruvate dehydrogenase (Acetyl-transferring) E1 component subunit alpha n=1 Tax=Saxibacter everestensis TaxID=2909229 RepID=A0ABY8QQ88_9MICO|nr:pyruvate dehydrogenase (acetyl-transferring) E1 component subunit alpha [Brevibacteriaceae bacterium ZFBP1038]
MSVHIERNEAPVLPQATPLTLINDTGHAVAGDGTGGFELPEPEILKSLYRRMVVARRFDTQVTALTRQGRLATYPSALGQEACEIGSVMALRTSDWLFPTYRDTIALLTRGISPADILEAFRGDWHSGYDPKAHRTAPAATPLATQALHAVGLGTAARLKGDNTVALTFLGDGATSEGDAHEAFNFAAVWQAPVIFMVQNNQFAISVPLKKQTHARMLADKAVGYGMPGYRVDGNDAAAVYAVVSAAVERARSGHGPTLIEGLTYRIEAHTNSDDPSRYRSNDDVLAWKARDPIERLEKYLVSQNLLSEDDRSAIAAEAESLAGDIRDAMNAEVEIDPLSLFDHVYAEPRPALLEQRQFLADELSASEDKS